MNETELQAFARRKPTSAEKTAKAVQLCNIAASQLGWKADGLWEGEDGIKMKFGNHLSLTEMGLAELDAILSHARQCGWKVKYKKPKGGKSRPLDQRPQVLMIRGLWLELAQMGEVRDASEAALASWIKRQTQQANGGEGLDAMQWVGDKSLNDLVEALKKWRIRTLKKGEFACGDCGQAQPPVDIRVALYVRDGNEALCPLCQSRLRWRRITA